jgi:hypothetical protein
VLFVEFNKKTPKKPKTAKQPAAGAGAAKDPPEAAFGGEKRGLGLPLLTPNILLNSK